MGQVWSKLESLPVKNEWKFALVNHVSHILSFWGPSLAFMLIRRFKLFQKYKIQPDADPAPKLVTEALRHVVQNIYKIPLLSVAFYRFLASGRRVHSARQGQQTGRETGSEPSKEKEAGDVERGWAALRFGGPRVAIGCTCGGGSSPSMRHPISSVHAHSTPSRPLSSREHLITHARHDRARAPRPHPQRAAHTPPPDE